MKVISNGTIAALITRSGDVIIVKAATIWEAWDMAQQYGAQLVRQ